MVGESWETAQCGCEQEPGCALAGSNGFCSSVSGSLEHHLIEGTGEGLGHPHAATAFG